MDQELDQELDQVSDQGLDLELDHGSVLVLDQVLVQVSVLQ